MPDKTIRISESTLNIQQFFWYFTCDCPCSVHVAAPASGIDGPASLSFTARYRVVDFVR